ncbi:MAG: flagellar biosynthesis protein FlgC [Micavibrio aeruginosavorus]|uniref:Flagellar biosynthesis protein FlgC n=1 Tax=Micavibrio aeruginosavorus TaxID=349221 RepID=A0A7T5R379_9BACT|nr:MAG: flagellar biosynthesis protein FlgC [Micavibrio aeruginosavorus]
MINAIQIALSGLTAASRKVEASASNIANMQTTGSLDNPEEAPYTPLATQQTALTDGQGNGLGVKSDFVPQTQPFIPAYDPDSPFANADGMIGVPNIDLAGEAVNLNIAKATYKANAAVIRTEKEMTDELLKTFDRKV